MGRTSSRTVRWARSLGSSLRDEVLRESPELTSRKPREYEHARLRVLARLDRRAERVELGELSALVVREEQVNGLIAIRKTRRDSFAQRVQPLAGQSGHLQRLREPV